MKRRSLTRAAIGVALAAAAVIGTTTGALAAPPPIPGPVGDQPGDSPEVGSARGMAIPTVPCDPAGPSASDGIMADQLNPQLRNKMAGYMNGYKVSCARVVTQAVKARGLNEKAAAIAVATIIVESSINNYSEAVDYDSVGLFQQRPSQGWGSPAECMDPVHATNKFLDVMQQFYPNGSWNNAPIGEVAADVQRPREDLRYLYGVEAGDATTIVNALWTGMGGGPKHPFGNGRVVTGRSADGRLEAFAAGADGVYHSWQTDPNAGWSTWRAEGGPRNAQLTIAANADGRLELFALSDSTLDHMWQTAPSGNWSSWANFGTGGYRVAAGNNADGRIEVFASNGSGVFHRWQTAPNGGWSGWEGTFGGPVNSRLAVENAPDGRLEVFALSDATFEHLWQTGVNGAWSSWENFGTGGHDVTVSYNQDGRLDVFASNASGVFHRWQTSPTAWSGWEGSGTITNAELATSRSVDGRIELFAVNASTASHTWQGRPNAAFSAWENFGTGGTEVAAGNNADGRIEVFGTSQAGVYHRWQTGFSTWSEWGWLNGSGPAVG
ncbi:hypothetical protein SAMN05421504_104374 [Amycolatopsis xylanica]|uniref:PLL-like beta propeller domain-containing protein n=1 Tax=Amycolatopsis xylanica TaxID=589385 RepID=A0A1H3GRK3_9PSEU|nr:VCBS repeat-containing protein [Amycolatopsis xylanica]SDY05901.1 hypothetical protein SAMN05421504_104374 [Amycolatopsis xylanica]